MASIYQNSFKVDGGVFKSPFSYTIEDEVITESQRSKSAKMLIKGVDHKYKVTLDFPSISNEEFKTLMSKTIKRFKDENVIEVDFTFIDYDYEEEGAITIRAYFTPLSRTRTPSSAAAGVWENVKISFIEI